MKYSVKYSKIALRDLERVWSEVIAASKDYNVTAQYMDDFMDKIEAKADFPESGTPLYYEDSFTGYYYVVFKAYIAFYRLEDKAIYVDRVLLGTSDYMRRLGIFKE